MKSLECIQVLIQNSKQKLFSYDRTKQSYRNYWEYYYSLKSNNIAFRISIERWGIDKNKLKGITKSFTTEQGVIFF